MQSEDTQIASTTPALTPDASAALRERLRETLEFEASFGDECHEIVDKLFALVAQTLRRDPRFAALRLSELDNLLRDALAPAERLICKHLEGMISVDDAVDHAMIVLTGDADDQGH